MSQALDDRELAARIGQGDRAAFEQLVERHQKLVFGYLRARLNDSAAAEDLTQEVFLRCYIGRARFDDTLPVRGWLLGYARNLLRDHHRKQRRSRVTAWTELCLELEPATPVGPSACHSDDRLDQLPQCLEHLGGKAREAIDLRYGGELPLAAIGDRLRRSEGAVKLLMFRARQALKRCLGGEPPQVAEGETE